MSAVWVGSALLLQGREEGRRHQVGGWVGGRVGVLQFSEQRFLDVVRRALWAGATGCMWCVVEGVLTRLVQDLKLPRRDSTVCMYCHSPSPYPPFLFFKCSECCRLPLLIPVHFFVSSTIA